MYALYLLNEEQNVEPGIIAAPQGFIYSIQPSAIPIPDGSGGADVPDGTDYFTHKIINGQVIAYTAEEIAQYFPPPKKWAQYGLPTEAPGFIHALISHEITRPMDLARLEKSGAKQIQVDAGVDHWTHKIDENGNAIQYTDDEKLQLQPPTLSVLDHILISLATGNPVDLAAVDPSIVARINTAISYNKLSIPTLAVSIETKSVTPPTMP